MRNARIDDLDYSVIRMVRKRPFVIATHRSQEVVNVLVRLRSGSSEGIGVIAPNIVTGDTENSALQFLKDLMEALPPNELSIAKLHDIMSSISEDHNAAKCGVDMAFHDLLARIEGKPLSDFMGRVRDRIETSVTIGIMEVEEALATAKHWWLAGFNILKLKVGLDMDRDLSVIREMRRRCPRMIIRVDCNQALTTREAISFLETISPLDIQLAEQPVDAEDIEGLCEVGRSSNVPVMADESVRSLEDIRKICSLKGVELVNIKLAKVGGMMPAREMAGLCERHGINAMMGCMSECEASISAGLHFALSRDCVVYADLDSHLSLMDDPTQAVSMDNGCLSPLPLPGLGVGFKRTDRESLKGSDIEWKAIR